MHSLQRKEGDHAAERALVDCCPDKAALSCARPREALGQGDIDITHLVTASWRMSAMCFAHIT